MTAHVLGARLTVCRDPELPSLIGRLHRAGDIDDTAATVYGQALVCAPGRLAASRSAALLLLALDPDLRAHADGLRLYAEFAPRGTPDLWGDLCRYSDEWQALMDDPSAIDAYLDPDVPMWSADGVRDEQLQQIAAERARVAAWLVTGGAL